jgi:predicted Zn-dependent protease
MKLMTGWFLLLAVFGCASVYGTDFGQFEQELKDAQQKIKDNPGAAAVLANVMGISQEEEIVIGRQIAGNLLGTAPLVKDNRLQTYVNNVGRWVAIQSERSDLPWHFGVIESDDINAFAAPGGYIFVTRGLYKQLSNEAALAGVLAHEIAHVVRQHHLKILQQSQLVDLGGKLVAQEVGGNDQAQKVIGSGAEIVARSLDKNAEFEADRMAVVLATRAGYDPYSFVEVLQQIGHVAQDDGSVALLFKTHPLPADRLDKLDKAMASCFDKVRGRTVEQRFYRIDKK